MRVRQGAIHLKYVADVLLVSFTGYVEKRVAIGLQQNFEFERELIYHIWCPGPLLRTLAR